MKRLIIKWLTSGLPHLAGKEQVEQAGAPHNVCGSAQADDIGHGERDGPAHQQERGAEQAHRGVHQTARLRHQHQRDRAGHGSGRPAGDNEL